MLSSVSAAIFMKIVSNKTATATHLHRKFCISFLDSFQLSSLYYNTYFHEMNNILKRLSVFGNEADSTFFFLQTDFNVRHMKKKKGLAQTAPIPFLHHVFNFHTN